MQEVIHRTYRIAGLATPTQVNMMFDSLMQMLYTILSQTTLGTDQMLEEIQEHLDAYLDTAPVPGG